MCDDRTLDKDSEEMEKIAESIEDKIGNDIDSLYELNDANLLINQFKYKQAEEIIISFINSQSNNVKAQALFLYGLLQFRLINLKEAESFWKQVNKTDNTYAYAEAQLELGNLKEDEQKPDDAEYHWKNITIDISKEHYAKAQFNLGMLYEKFGKITEAEKFWNAISQDMSEEEYGYAQFNLGCLNREQNDVEKAELHWSNITINSDRSLYAKAQFNLAYLKILQGEIKKAEEYLKNILFEMDVKQYSKAQYSLGLLADSIEITNQYWENIPFHNDDISKKIFSDIIQIFWEQRDSFKFQNVANYYLKVKNIPKICNFTHELMNNISLLSGVVQDKSSNIFDEVQKIANILHLGNEEFSKYDNSFAHYTRHTTALRVLDTEKSAFRLSSMHFMNDPKEGKLINDLLDIDVGKQYEDSKHLAFASCFSFNHNSLNQFRLYGKTDGQENSGVSLVFNKDFFQMDMSENTNIDASIARMQSVNSEISNIFFKDKKQDNSSITTTFDESEKICLYQAKQKKEIEKVEKQPLYRCIYVDPESGYLRVARRSKISFYRSAKTRESAQEEYSKYVESLDKADEEIHDCINNLKNLVEELKGSLNEESCEQQEKVWMLVNDILLPLRYLIKHAAFEEEEECRMIYITDMCDSKIQSDPEKKWLYVEYAEPVKDHIKKVYLGDGAKDYCPFFERALADKSKVKDSNNPFRI